MLSVENDSILFKVDLQSENGYTNLDERAMCNRLICAVVIYMRNNFSSSTVDDTVDPCPSGSSDLSLSLSFFLSLLSERAKEVLK